METIRYEQYIEEEDTMAADKDGEPLTNGDTHHKQTNGGGSEGLLTALWTSFRAATTAPSWMWSIACAYVGLVPSFSCHRLWFVAINPLARVLCLRPSMRCPSQGRRICVPG